MGCRTPRRRVLAVLSGLVLAGATGCGAKHGSAVARGSMGSPAWSPDGRSIAWTEVMPGPREQMWIGARDTSDAHPVGPPIDVLGQVAWLPGRRLLYWANSRLFVLEPGGRSALLSNAAGDGFSVDARRTTVATGDASCSSGCYGQVRIWRLRGGTMREVGGRYVQNTSPSLSAGGSRIAFSRTFCERATGRCERPAGIWVASVRSGRLTRITRTGYCPDWSRDGRAIVYVDNVDGSLRVVPAVGGRSIRLLRDIGGCNLSSPPAWSPDARTIAAVDSHAGGLRLVDARTRRWHAVAIGIVGGFAWSPDSTELLVSARPTPQSCSSLWLVTRKGVARVLRDC